MTDRFDKRTSLAVLRERWWMIVLPAVVGAVLAYGLAASQTKLYQAQANVLFQSTSFDQLLFGQSVSSQPPSTPTAPIDTDMRLLGARSVAQSVILRLRLSTTPAALLRQISINEQLDSNVVTLAVRDPNPVRAAAIANAWVASYLVLAKAANQAPLVTAARSLKAGLAGVRGGAPTLLQRQLSSRLAQLELLSQLQTAGARQSQVATAPSSPVSPRPVRDAAVGGIVGAALGFIVAFGAALLDQRIKTVEEAEAVYGTPVLAIIPRHRRRDGDLPTWRAADESFQMLRSMIRFNSLDRAETIKTILITSAGVGDGKSTCAAGLGLAAASAGMNVLCIDGDMRRPTLPEKLSCPVPARGLVDTLVEGEGLHAALVDVSLPSVPAPALPSGHERGSLRLLSVGVTPPNAAELIASGAFQRAIRDLTLDPMFDLVIIDSPPVVAVADAAALAPLCDVVLVVARANHSRRGDGKQGMTILRRAGIPVLGIVLMAVHRARGYYDYSSTGSHHEAAGEADAAELSAERSFS